MLVRGVHALIAEDAARRDHAQRRPQLLHAAHLHRRSVGAQQMAAVQPERVLHVARGMVRRNVQRVEIVIFGFDLGAVEHGEAEGPEQVFNLPLNLRDRDAGCPGATPGAGTVRSSHSASSRFASAARSNSGLRRFAGAFESLLRGIDELAAARRALRAGACPCLC